MSTDLIRRGEVVEFDARDAQLEALQDENRQLRADLATAKREAQRARAESHAALAALRKQLQPLYQALQMVFGEIEAAGVTDTASAPSSSVNPRVAAVYESWKQRLGGMAAKVIDALLLHGEMNTTQLAIAAQIHRTNVPRVIYRLNQAGLINKNGGRFSLKQL